MTRSRILRVLKPGIAQETVIFTVASLAVSLMSAIATALVARSLTTSDYGAYAFALQLLLLVALVFELGVFLPAAREAAAASPGDQRLVAGATVRVFIPIAVAFGLVIALTSGFVDRIFHVQAGEALRLAAPLAFVYPASQLTLLVAQACGRLNAYSLSSTIGQAAALIFVVVLFIFGALTSATVALAARGAGLAVGWLLFAGMFRPRIRGSSPYVRRILQGARSYGLNAYLGRLLAIGTYNMDVLMLGGLSTPEAVAIYTIAGQLATTGGVPVTGLTSALFSRSSKQGSVDPRWLIAAAIGGAIPVAVFALFGAPIVDLMFTARYAAAATLLVPLSLAQLLRGVTGVYNVYLSSNGHGRELRNAGLVLTVSNVIFNITLIPAFAAAGAAWASLLALAANLGAHIFWYRRVRTRISSAAPPSLVPRPALRGLSARDHVDHPGV